MKIKKLKLSKETVMHLDGGALENVGAGVYPTDITAACSTCTRICSECCAPVTLTNYHCESLAQTCSC